MTQGIAYTPEETEQYKKQIVEYLAESIHGTFSAACHKYGVSKTIGYEWRTADPEFNKSVDAARHSAKQSGLDMAEGKLMKKINDEDTTSILFYLKTQGKDRGYIERQETDSTLKADIQVNSKEQRDAAVAAALAADS